MQDPSPLISVIVPVYNVEQYLEQCLDSIIGQSYPHLEIILVNDGSTDRSGAICNEYATRDKRIKVIHKENDGSPSSTRNAGLNAMTGDYVSFVDSDDWIEPEMYHDLVRLMENKKHLDLVKFGAIKKPKHLNKRGDYGLREYTSLKGYMMAGCDDVVWNALYRSDLLRDIRFMEGIVCEDLHFTYLLFSRPQLKFGVYNRRYYHYRAARPGSIMSSKGLKLKSDMLLLWEDLLNRITDNRDIAILMCISNLRAMEIGMIKSYKRGVYTLDDLEFCQKVIRQGWQLVRQYPIPTDWDFVGLMTYIKCPLLYWLLVKPLRYIQGGKFLVHK